MRQIHVTITISKRNAEGQTIEQMIATARIQADANGYHGLVATRLTRKVGGAVKVSFTAVHIDRGHEWLNCPDCEAQAPGAGSECTVRSCGRTCTWETLDADFIMSVSWRGIDGEAPCSCEHHDEFRQAVAR